MKRHVRIDLTLIAAIVGYLVVAAIGNPGAGALAGALLAGAAWTLTGLRKTAPKAPAWLDMPPLTPQNTPQPPAGPGADPWSQAPLG
jgi:hypothetical protein